MAAAGAAAAAAAPCGVSVAASVAGVRGFLAAAGLGRYAETFEAEAIDGAALLELTDAELRGSSSLCRLCKSKKFQRRSYVR